MSLQQDATHIPVSHDRHREADTQLRGRRLVLARIIWLALVVFTLSICIASLPDYFAELETECQLAVCAYGQLSHDSLVALEHLGLSVGSYATCMFVLATLVAMTFFGTAGVIFWRKSDDWVALLMALGVVLGGTIPVLITVGTGPSALRVPIRAVSELGFLVFFLCFTLFPSGRLVPRWTLWLLAAFSIVSVVVVGFTNPLTVTGSSWIVVSLDLLFFALYAGLIIAQVYRYRYVSTLMQRQQTKWVVFGLSVNIVISIGAFLPVLIFPISLATLVFLLVYICALFIYPFTIGVAILRSHLWDIDILINRTLVYGSLTVSLAFIYFSLIFALQSLLSGMIKQNNAVAIVVSTLAIYALFQPLRRRIQTIIDRRFYRHKYDAARTLAAFTTTLRHELDISRLSEDLIAVIQETMQPAHISLWLRPTTKNRNEQALWNNSPLAPERHESEAEK